MLPRHKQRMKRAFLQLLPTFPNLLLFSAALTPTFLQFLITLPRLCNSLPLPNFISILISKHWFHSAFSHLLYIFFKCNTSITQSHKSGMGNGFRIVFVKINIIKANIINIYATNTHFITKKCDITRIFIKKEYIIITNKAL